MTRTPQTVDGEPGENDEWDEPDVNRPIGPIAPQSSQTYEGGESGDDGGRDPGRMLVTQMAQKGSVGHGSGSRTASNDPRFGGFEGWDSWSFGTVAQVMSGGLRGGKLASLTGRPARWIGVVTVVSIGLLIWWWPGLTSDPGEVDVELVIGDGLAVADQSIDRRLREEGFMIARTRRPVDWCSVPEALGDMRSESTRLVVWAEATADCDLGDAVDRVVEQARGRRVIVVVLPSDGPMIADAVVMRLAAEGACRRRLKREWRKAYLWALRDEP